MSWEEVAAIVVTLASSMTVATASGAAVSHWYRRRRADSEQEAMMRTALFGSPERGIVPRVDGLIVTVPELAERIKALEDAVASQSRDIKQLLAKERRGD